MIRRRITRRCFHTATPTLNRQKVHLRLPGDDGDVHCLNTADPSLIVLPDLSLTNEEMSFIESNPFLSKIKIANKLKDLDPKVQRISKYIPIHNGFLSFKRPHTTPTPFEMLKLPQNPNLQLTDAVSRRIPISKFPRLSVTKLLTDSWCELREFYETYSQTTRPETIAMTRGKEIHHDLEVMTHPLEDFSEILLNLPTVSKSHAETIADAKVESIIRLMNLFMDGHAREIYLHTFMNELDGVVEDRDILPTDMLVTGIIDHLILQSSYIQTNPIKEELRHVGNIGEFVKDLGNLVEQHGSRYRICVSDVKTRSRRIKPTQASVVDASKHQVMFYEKFLRVFGASEMHGYKYLDEYYKRQNVDIDQPIAPEYVISLIATNGGVFHEDFLKISRGESIGIKEYDDVEYDKLYDLSQYTDIINDEELSLQLKPYLVNWSKPLTLRYFFARLSQLFHQISKLLRGDLRIEYYFHDELFEFLQFKYNEENVQEIAKRSLQYWNGSRDPSPIEPTFKNISEKCRYCDFNDNCSWKFNFEKRNHIE